MRVFLEYSLQEPTIALYFGIVYIGQRHLDFSALPLSNVGSLYIHPRNGLFQVQLPISSSSPWDLQGKWESWSMSASA